MTPNDHPDPALGAAPNSASDDTFDTPASTPDASPRAGPRAGTRLLGPGLAAGGAPPPRRPTTPDDATAAAAARALFAQINPAVPASYARALAPPLAPFFAPSLLWPTTSDVPLSFALGEAVVNSSPLYLQGAASGVGSSVLAAEYARQFNAAAHANGDPRRVLYVKLARDTKSFPQFLDALALALRAPLRHAEIRLRSNNYLAARIRAAALQARVVAFVFDHVRHLAPGTRGVIASLLEAFDPLYDVPLDGDPTGPAAPRIGAIIVDHLPPEELFEDHPDAVGHLRGRHCVLQPYTTCRQMAEAMEAADIGLAPNTLDLDDADDRAMVARVLELTSGLAVQLNPFLARLAAIARACRTRPNAALVEAVLPYHREMLELLQRPGTGPGGRDYRTRVIPKRPNGGGWRRVRGDGTPEHAGIEDSDAANGRDEEPTASACRDAKPGDVASDAEDDGGRAPRSPEKAPARGKASRKRVLRDKRRVHDDAERIKTGIKRRGGTNP